MRGRRIGSISETRSIVVLRMRRMSMRPRGRMERRGRNGGLRAVSGGITGLSDLKSNAERRIEYLCLG